MFIITNASLYPRMYWWVILRMLTLKGSLNVVVCEPVQYPSTKSESVGKWMGVD